MKKNWIDVIERMRIAAHRFYWKAEFPRFREIADLANDLEIACKKSFPEFGRVNGR